MDCNICGKTIQTKDVIVMDYDKFYHGPCYVLQQVKTNWKGVVNGAQSHQGQTSQNSKVSEERGKCGDKGQC